MHFGSDDRMFLEPWELLTTGSRVIRMRFVEGLTSGRIAEKQPTSLRYQGCFVAHKAYQEKDDPAVNR